jgi:hypothetical protein
VWSVKTHSPNPGEFWLETPISPIAVKLPSSPKMATLSNTRGKIFPDRLIIDFPVLLVIEIRIIIHPPIGCLTATDGSAIMICLKVSARRRIKMMKNL